MCAIHEASCSNVGVCATGLSLLQQWLLNWFIFALGLLQAFPWAAKKTDFIYVFFNTFLNLLSMLSEGNGTSAEKYSSRYQGMCRALEPPWQTWQQPALVGVAGKLAPSPLRQLSHSWVWDVWTGWWELICLERPVATDFRKGTGWGI